MLMSIRSLQIKDILSEPFTFTKVKRLRGSILVDEKFILLSRSIMTIHLRSYNGQDLKSHFEI